jgi:hypothetical protein
LNNFDFYYWLLGCVIYAYLITLIKFSLKSKQQVNLNKTLRKG